MYYFNYAGALKSQRFHDRLYFLPHVLPLFDIVCFGRSTCIAVAVWELRVGQRQSVQPFLTHGRGEKSAVIVGHTTAVKQTLSSIQTKGFSRKKLTTEDLNGKRQALLESSGKKPSAKIQGWCSTNFTVVLLRGADGAVWMLNSTGFVVSLYLSPWSKGFVWLIRWKPESRS